MSRGLSDLHWSSQLFLSPEQMELHKQLCQGKRWVPANCRLLVTGLNYMCPLPCQCQGKYPRASSTKVNTETFREQHLWLTWLGGQVRGWCLARETVTSSKHPELRAARSLTWHRGEEKEGACPQPPMNIAILECWVILTWTILKMMRKLPQFKCTLSKWLKKTKMKKKFLYQQFHNWTPKSLNKFIIQTQLSLASMLFRLCKECRKEAVNIFLKEKEKQQTSHWRSCSSLGREGAFDLFSWNFHHKLDFFWSSLPLIQIYKDQPQVNHLTSPREQHSRNDTISYLFPITRTQSLEGWSGHTDK